MVYKDNWLTFEPNLASALTMRLEIPNDPNILKALYGVLFELCEAENWTFSTGISPEEMSELWMVIVDTMRKGDEMNLLGTILAYATTSPPPNCLDCDGSTYQRVDYPALYNELGNTFQINEDSFFVPDLRGRFPLGVSGSHAINSSGGSETHTLDISEIPSHTHTVNNPNAAVQEYASGSDKFAVPSRTIPFNTGSSGGGGSHNNMPPFLSVKYCIVAV